MATWSGRVLYIDGFAGPGKYKGGEYGSPAIVLQAARDHKYPPKAEVIFIFVEADKARFEHLQHVVAGIEPSLPKNFKVHTVYGRFDELLQKVFQDLDEQRKRLAPALVFVDPFGFSHTPFSTIVRILQSPRSEVLITFMYEEINRFLAHPEQPENYGALFGTEEWRKALGVGDPEERRRIIHDLYLEQLQKVAQYVRSFEMLNKGNRTDYFLFFASNNLLGLEKMKEAMWKVAPGGDYQFSDYTDSRGVLSLFGDKPDYEQLKHILVRQFKSQDVGIEAIEEFVVAQTPFLKTHIRRATLKPMEEAGGLVVVRTKPDRRVGTFPEGTVVRFK
jgi:three-Cys-motif partner protein